MMQINVGKEEIVYQASIDDRGSSHDASQGEWHRY